MPISGDRIADSGFRFAFKLCALVALCSLGLFSYSLVMFAPLLVLVAVGFAPWYLVRAIRRLRMRSAADRALAPKPGWRVPVLLAIAATWTGGYFLHVHIAEQRVAPLIAAAERYRAEHGEYPRTVAQIGPQLLAGFDRVHEIDHKIIGFHDGSLLGLGLGTYAVFDDDRFTVGFVTFGFNKHDYDSRRKQWRNWD
jgi:hypothetical protein